jgi:hypothetical protein
MGHRALQRSAELDQYHGTRLVQIAGLFERPGQTDAELGHDIPCQFHACDQLDAGADQNFVCIEMAGCKAGIQKASQIYIVQKKRKGFVPGLQLQNRHHEVQTGRCRLAGIQGVAVEAA